jgi:hypothetical protein
MPTLTVRDYEERKPVQIRRGRATVIGPRESTLGPKVRPPSRLTNLTPDAESQECEP